MCGLVKKSTLVKCQSKVASLEAGLNTAIVANRELIAKLNPPPPPSLAGLITAEEVRALLLTVFPGQDSKIFLADICYEITAKSEIRSFIDWDNTNIFPYEAEYHDCDEFALALAGDFAKYPGWSGLPTGFIWSTFLDGHAYFIEIAWPSFEDRTPTVYYVEPQNDWEISEESLEEVKLHLLVM